MYSLSARAVSGFILILSSHLRPDILAGSFPSPIKSSAVNNGLYTRKWAGNSGTVVWYSGPKKDCYLNLLGSSRPYEIRTGCPFTVKRVSRLLRNDVSFQFRNSGPNKDICRAQRSWVSDLWKFGVFYWFPTVLMAKRFSKVQLVDKLEDPQGVVVLGTLRVDRLIEATGRKHQ